MKLCIIINGSPLNAVRGLLVRESVEYLLNIGLEIDINKFLIFLTDNFWQLNRGGYSTCDIQNWNDCFLGETGRCNDNFCWGKSVIQLISLALLTQIVDKFEIYFIMSRSIASGIKINIVYIVVCRCPLDLVELEIVG